MPLIRIDAAPEVYRQPEIPEADYSAADIVGAAFETESDIYGIYRAVTDDKPEPTEQERMAYLTGEFNPLVAIQGTRHDTDERRAEFAADPDYAWDVLAEGARRATVIASEVIAEVKDAIGLPEKR